MANVSLLIPGIQADHLRIGQADGADSGVRAKRGLHPRNSQPLRKHLPKSVTYEALGVLSQRQLFRK